MNSSIKWAEIKFLFVTLCFADFGVVCLRILSKLIIFK